MAVFFDVEKAYDMVWKEGLMIKLDMIGITGRIYNSSQNWESLIWKIYGRKYPRPPRAAS